ncbi:MAG: DUF6765 family protein [Betaproteobacteria bacterium]
MQIDFHFGATYAIARIAGFDDAQAHTIAYSAQYVDDSTTSGFLRFDNGVRFYRRATAHPPIDLKNVDNDVGSQSWLPFHFLPGNEGLETRAPLDGAYRRRLICRPDSFVARAMMRDVIEAKLKNGEHSLHRLGIAAHVFIDTFAHRGFIGERTAFNEVGHIDTAAGRALQRMPVPPVGHGQVSTYPDRPFLHWRYENNEREWVERNNPVDFSTAANRLCEEFQRYRLGDPDALVPGLGSARARIETLIGRITDDDGDARLAQWMEALKDGYFDFGPATPGYIGKGRGSWKHVALGENYLLWLQSAQRAVDAVPDGERNLLQRIGATLLELGVHHAEALAEHLGLEPVTYPFRESFLGSDYKRFHDAAEEQRFAVFKKILPRFGIFAA